MGGGVASTPPLTGRGLMQSVAAACVHGDHLWAVTYFCVPNHSSSTQHIFYSVQISMFGIKTYINPSCYRGGGGVAHPMNLSYLLTSYQWMLSVDRLRGK